MSHESAPPLPNSSYNTVRYVCIPQTKMTTELPSLLGRDGRKHCDFKQAHRHHTSNHRMLWQSRGALKTSPCATASSSNQRATDSTVHELPCLRLTSCEMPPDKLAMDVDVLGVGPGWYVGRPDVVL